MTKPRIWRRVGWAIGGVAIASAVAAAIVLGAPLVRVEVAPVTRGSWERVVDEDGRARVSERFVISSPLAGTLERLTLHTGDCVTRGDTLATLHPGPPPLLDRRSQAELEARRSGAEASLASARTMLERAESNRAHAETELTRAQSLRSSGAITPRDLEHAELEASGARRERDAARFGIAVAAHELDMVRASLSAVDPADTTLGRTFVLSAPIDGCILVVHHEDEAIVTPGMPLLDLADPSVTEVVVDLLSTDAVRVRPGDDATLHGFGLDDSLRGRVRLVEPTATVRVSALGVEEQRVDVVVDPTERSDAWSRVGDGYRVDVSIVIERIDDTLRVPTNALFREGERWTAFEVVDGRVRRVDVDVTRYGPITSAVAGGLPEGALLVTEPPADLREGDRVEAVPAVSAP